MPKTKDYHECSLSTKFTAKQLYPIHPNASRAARLLRSIRSLCSMDPENVKSKHFFRNKSTMLAEQKRHANRRYKFVIHPFSKLNNFIEIAFFISWVWQFFTVPVVYGFDYGLPLIFYVALIMLNAVRYCVFLSFFFVGYADYRRKEIIIEPKKIVFRYLRTHFIFDLIAIFYEDVATVFSAEVAMDKEYYVYTYIASVIATIAYFTRFNAFVSALEDITKMLHAPKAVYKILLHLFIITLSLNILTCSLFSLPKLFYGGDIPDDSWLTQAQLAEIDKVPFINLYTESLGVAFSFFFGIDHDKYTFEEPGEEIILIVASIFGRIYTLYLLADFLKIFGLVGISESKYEQYLGQLEEYMNSKSLPDELKIRLLKYYEFKLQKHYFNEGEILATLSQHLKNEMFLFGARKLIEKAQLLKTLPRPTLASLFASMHSETFMPTDIIIKAGSPAEDVYFISTGTVAVINSEDTELTHLEDGDEFGFLVTSDKKLMYTHVAVETSEIYYISKKSFLEFMAEHPEIFKYYESKVRKRIERINYIEASLILGGHDVLSSLRSGKLLETQAVRSGFYDVET